MGAGPTAQSPARTINRRQLFKYGASAGAVATIAPMLPPLTTAAHAHGLPRVLPAPKPIPGGIQVPGGPFIHSFIPGPPDVTLPFSGLQLQGLDVEPSLITDYQGFTALAYLVGTARGSDGNQYLLEADLRAMEGRYVAEDGTRHRGLFAFIWIDLFEPGPGSTVQQVHDLNGGIPPSGLFWVVQLPKDAFRVSHDGRRATLEAEDVCVIDSFQIFAPGGVPASVSFTVTWEATGPRELRGKGATVPPTDPAAFLGRFAPARATASISGVEIGFSFRSNPGVSSDRGFAELGPERNGVFLSWGVPFGPEEGVMRYRLDAERLKRMPPMTWHPGGVFRSARSAPVGPTHAVDVATGAVAWGIAADGLQVPNDDWEAACFVEKCPGCFAAVIAHG